jgi:hypothetical protein
MPTVKQSSNRIKTFKSNAIQLDIKVVGDIGSSIDVHPKRKPLFETNRNLRVLQSFEQAQPISFTERFPRLTCFLISCGIITAALVMEIEALRGAGYFWR